MYINKFNGNNYEYDDNNFTEFDSEHYAFCYSRVIPYSLEFNKFGYVGVVNSCNNLENEYNTTTKKLFFVHTNNLGSTIALTDSSGSIVQSYDYDSHGKTYVMNSSGTYVSIDDYKGNLHGNDRLFTGREYDSETNLYFYRARYYSPELGRFISRDPIDTEDDVNLYSYVGDNPVNGVDPSGLMIKKLIGYGINYMVLFPASLTTGGLGQYDNSFQTAPGLLFYFTAGNGKNKKFTNGHPIANGVKNSNFYNIALNEIKKGENINRIMKGEAVNIEYKKGQDVSGNENNIIKELDLGGGLGNTTVYLNGHLDKDGNIETSLKIVDRYDFHDNPDLGFINNLGVMAQKSGAGKPFDYTVEVKDKLFINK